MFATSADLPLSVLGRRTRSSRLEAAVYTYRGLCTPKRFGFKALRPWQMENYREINVRVVTVSFVTARSEYMIYYLLIITRLLGGINICAFEVKYRNK